MVCTGTQRLAAHLAAQLALLCPPQIAVAPCPPAFLPGGGYGTCFANLTLIPLDTGAACLDGSAYGHYFTPSPSGSDQWTIFLQGGGWCYDENGCLSRSTMSLGSSKFFPQNSTDCECYNIRDGEPVTDCNCIFLPYGAGLRIGLAPSLWGGPVWASRS